MKKFNVILIGLFLLSFVSSCQKDYDYDCYLAIEYDVFLNDNWSKFFDIEIEYTDIDGHLYTSYPKDNGLGTNWGYYSKIDIDYITTSSYKLRVIAYPKQQIPTYDPINSYDFSGHIYISTFGGGSYHSTDKDLGNYLSKLDKNHKENIYPSPIVGNEMSAFLSSKKILAELSITIPLRK